MNSRGDGPFQVLERINDNAYKIDLPGEYNVSPTFNVSDLSLYDVGEDSRTNPFEESENDTNKQDTSSDPLQIPSGPITRAQVRRLQETLNGLFQKAWARQRLSESNYFIHVSMIDMDQY